VSISRFVERQVLGGLRTRQRLDDRIARLLFAFGYGFDVLRADRVATWSGVHELSS
jgi:hypothetical protein